MKAKDIKAAGDLIYNYCDLCDSVLEKMEMDFYQTPALVKFNLIARKLDGSPWRIALSFEGVDAFRFGFDKNQCGNVFTEGFRIASSGEGLLVDFDDDPDNVPGEKGWDLSSSRWLVCSAIGIEDVAEYEPDA